MQKENITIVCFSQTVTAEELKVALAGWEVKVCKPQSPQKEYVRSIEEIKTEWVVFADADRLSGGMIKSLAQTALKQEWGNKVGYATSGHRKLWLGTISNIWGADKNITNAPFLIAEKKVFLKAYGGSDLGGNSMQSVAYSLQKAGCVKFRNLSGIEIKQPPTGENADRPKLWFGYSLRVPFRYLVSGDFFRELFVASAKVQRDMVYRMLMLLFICFAFLYMPVISKDYGISGDEIMEHNHSQLVLNYFENGDKAATYQPKTTTHFYGISLQIICGAIARYCGVDDVYALRHVVCAVTGAAGILFAGLLGLRWGGGLCGLLSVLLMFFTPRYFGHSMNNLKDVPFAVGYIASIYYTIRLFDTFPRFRLNYMLGLLFGVTLALSTRSGGLVLYPMVLMYAGLTYILYYGWKNFYKFVKYRQSIVDTFTVLIMIGVAAYFLSILLWPFALEKPFTNMFVSLKQFTHFSIGLRTIFEGKQMMSNMLPWHYAPKYFMIGVPVITILGFWGYILYCCIKRKEFSLISYFMLFSAIFPVFWVIYKNSNLYGGIRHLLFVMPVMVVIASRFWGLLLDNRRKIVKGVVAGIFVIGLALPMTHMIRNHPNDYVYFNEFVGGLKGVYGDYETDYYYNSLKESTDWFKKHVDYKGKKLTIATNHLGVLEHYFRKDTNVKVIYTRYYEKYSKDWDYAIFANVYINTFQLKHGLFPPDGAIHTSQVDGFPMSALIERQQKEELKGFRLEKEKKYAEALAVFREVVEKQPKNEEVWARMAKLAYMLDQPELGVEYATKCLQYQPELNEGLYILAMSQLQLKKYNEAIKAARIMLRQNISSVDAYYLQALAFKGMGKYKEAIDQLNRAVAYRPNYERALVLAGDILVLARNYQSAMQVYERAFKEAKRLETVVAMADCAVRMKNYELAVQMLEQAEKAQENYGPALRVRLRMALQKQDLGNARKLIERIGGMENDVELIILKAIYLKMTNREEEAITCIEKALKSDPFHPEALEWKRSLAGKKK